MPDKKWIALILCVVLLLIIIASFDQEKAWDGVDVAVVGRFGAELGREPSNPLINLQGDALLFAFTVSGVIGGFIAGYFWREIFSSSARPKPDCVIRDKETTTNV